MAVVAHQKSAEVLATLAALKDVAWLDMKAIELYSGSKASMMKKALQTVRGSDFCGLKLEKRQNEGILAHAFVHSDNKKLYYTTSITIPLESGPITGQCACKARYEDLLVAHLSSTFRLTF